MAFPAFFDACAIYGITLSDLLLRLADDGVFRPLWSEQVLDEVRRNAVAAGASPSRIDRRLSMMRTYFPDALVTGHEDLAEGLTCDPKDRHVLAAAVRAGADVLVTFNLRDFPPASLAVLDVETVHPDDFLLDQLDLFPGVVTRVLRELAEDYVDPPQSVEDILDTLRRAGVPRFAIDVRRYL
ncbi:MULTISPECIES: PIN domain-containing protein [unclassified Curtobacterium]|uniref:PIN domain-containing protein n=1 Tax=unclassified Curtobacterium TaxID=257496 RepID=UPI000F46ED89|nr:MULTISPECIES: PIN domain-containing protein [unclassified Curtobacterium]ROQ17237.1 PIN domain-containing protein [Curtobacterium sp. PhB171]ROQ29519.1 PIN domain-containing protein [Curtobacterium sp. PhB170]ROS45336.1 PIN domain-containing protein [Curtobacterium sp. PhB131]ROS65956.1 PIN domain-containing protein [Curtobacterium sp. PhB141]